MWVYFLLFLMGITINGSGGDVGIFHAPSHGSQLSTVQVGMWGYFMLLLMGINGSGGDVGIFVMLLLVSVNGSGGGEGICHAAAHGHQRFRWR